MPSGRKHDYQLDLIRRPWKRKCRRLLPSQPRPHRFAALLALPGSALLLPPAWVPSPTHRLNFKLVPTGFALAMNLTQRVAMAKGRPREETRERRPRGHVD